MSRGYRIQWATASRTVKSSDQITLQVGFLGILPEAEMRGLLRDELERDGWKGRSGGALATEIDGIAVELDADGKTVTARAAGERVVEGRAETAAAAEQRAEGRVGQAERALTRELGQRLARAEPDLRAALEAAVQRVYVEALKRKAASFGAVESCSESTDADGTHEVRIVVRT
jgi:hypothetical protein